MELETLTLPQTNNVLQAYTNNQQFQQEYFDYPVTAQAYKARWQELEQRTYDRTNVAAIVRAFMEPFGISEQTETHLQELAQNAVVVIGGQQAGLLTGPLYSVHKAITVILLAKKQREELQVPVVPIFWVAGEDHDLNEINHVYTEEDGNAVKRQYEERFVLKVAASDATYNQQELAKFVQKIFAQFGETAYTKPLLADVLEAVYQETTFTKFFVHLMNQLFKKEGLLFIDSAYKPLRELEAPFFVKLIDHAKEVSHSVVQREQRFEKEGFKRPVDAQLNAANVFYMHETGRQLLTWNGEYFENDASGIRFSKEQLIEIATNAPWLLSNNVVTRPLMQDYVFPVLAFVGGPGELAYWALLKDAFHILHMKMPIFVPRISMTIVTKQVEKAMKSLNVTVEQVMNGQLNDDKRQFVESIQDEQFTSTIEHIQQSLTQQYEELFNLSEEKDQTFQQLVEKNLQFHLQQLQFLLQKEQAFGMLRQSTVLRQYSLLEGHLFPNGGLQERTYTPYMLLNEYGLSLIDRLLEAPLKLNEEHQIVFL